MFLCMAADAVQCSALVYVEYDDDNDVTSLLFQRHFVTEVSVALYTQQPNGIAIYHSILS